VGGASVHDDPHREHALGLDPDVEVRRLAGDREVRAGGGRVPTGDDRVGGALVELLGLLVGHTHHPHPDRVLVGEVAQRAQHRRQSALHVVGAAADQPVALDPRGELLGAPGDHVEMAVEHDAGRVRIARADLGDEHRQTVVVVLAQLNSVRLQPALHEPGGSDDRLRA
jgi:hypothetical protein